MSKKKRVTKGFQSKKEVADSYPVSAKVFAKMMRTMTKHYPVLFPAEDKHAHLLSPAQVQKILEFYGSTD